MKFQKSIKRIMVVACMMMPGMWIMPAAMADGEVVLQQDFSKITSLEVAGWKLFPGQATEFSLKDGCLKMLFSNAPYKGGYIQQIIPVISSGTLTFEVALNTNGAQYDHLSLQIYIYNLNLSFKMMGNQKLQRYYDEKWKDVADNVPVGKKIKVKVVFDNNTKIVQYFIDDMENPVMIDENITLVPVDTSVPLLLIKNYGLATGKLEHKMYNISLTK